MNEFVKYFFGAFLSEADSVLVTWHYGDKQGREFLCTFFVGDGNVGMWPSFARCMLLRSHLQLVLANSTWVCGRDTVASDSVRRRN